MILEKVPPELVINWDHTVINNVPVSNWTMAKEGSNISAKMTNIKQQQFPQGESLEISCYLRYCMMVRVHVVYHLSVMQRLACDFH